MLKRNNRRLKTYLTVVFLAGVLAAGLAVSGKSYPVRAQCDKCDNINKAYDCDVCGGRIYCTCACDIFCYAPNNCSCDATLCEWLEDGDPGNTAPNCDPRCGCEDFDDVYTSVCIECGSCVGDCYSDNCLFDCPDYDSPVSLCMTVCDEPEPTPEPEVTPTPTPIPTPVVDYPPICQILSGPTEVCVGDSATYAFAVDDFDGDLDDAEAYQSLTIMENLTLMGDIPLSGGSVSTSFSSQGRYYVMCNAYDQADNWCTANPWCPWEPVRADDHACDGWVDCNSNGLDWMEVTAYNRPRAPVNITRAGLVCDASSVNLRWVPTAIITRNTTFPYRVDVAPNSWDGSCAAPDYCNNTSTATSVVWPVTNCSVYDVWAHQVNSDILDACEYLHCA